MADVLSQSEIDALLNAISAGEIETTESEAEATVREYDFRTANRFHKEQIRTLRIIHDTFARLFAAYLSGTLRVMCVAEVLSVEELKYQEFVNSLPEPVLLGVLRQPPLVGSILLEISPDISFAMISRLLGGAAAGAGITREFTEIELVLLERVIRQFLPLFAESWEKIIKVSTSLDRIETSAQFAQIVASNETVAIVTVNVTIGDVSGLVNICLPHLSIEPINRQLSTKMIYQSGTEREMEPATDDIRNRLEKSPLGLTAVFKPTTLTVGEVLNLQHGDVVQLEHLLSDPLVLKVAHLPKFKVELGVKDNRYAVKIAETIHKEDTE